jgi:hypothetical protein
VKALVRGFLLAVALVIVGYLVWDRVEVWRLGRDIKAIAARGEPIDLSSLEAPLPTPQHEEAARLYADAAIRAREIAQQDFRLGRIDLDAVVGQPVDVAELEATYRPDAPALQLLDRATTLPFAGFGDTGDGPEWMTIQGLQSLNALAALRVDLYAYRGDGDAAARALVAAIGLQRTLPDTFYRYTIGARQLGSLRILLRHSAPSAAALASLQQAFEGLPDEDGLVRELMLRRARLIDERSGSFFPGGASRAAAFLFHPFLTRMGRIQIEQYPEAIAAARQPWPDKFATLSTLAAESGPRANRSYLRSALTGRGVNVAALSTAPMQAGLNLAVRRVAVATLAIERYRRAHGGALPPALDALVPTLMPAVPIDPFSGQPIVFKPAADGYFVYSVDINRREDGPTLYGTGSMNPMPVPRLRDFGIKVPLTPRAVAK